VQALARGQGEAELGDEEGHAVSAIHDRVLKRERRGSAEHAREKLRGGGPVERLHRDLVQPAVTPQLGPQPPDRMPARHVIAPVRRDQQHRLPIKSARERGQEVERRVVGPLQVVEEHGHGLAGGRERQHRPDRLEQRPPVARRRRLAELGQQHREMRPQRNLTRHAGLPEHVDDRPIRRPTLLHTEALEPLQPGVREHGPCESRLPHPRLTGEQHDRATPVTGLRRQRFEGGMLGLTADQVFHGPTLRERQTGEHGNRAVLQILPGSTSPLS
jgi:hypothetical protein